jgi:hypothetical protein
MMKRLLRLSRSILGISIAFSLMAGLMATSPAWSRAVKVMDVDEVGDAAMIANAKSKKRAENGLPGQDGINSSSSGCSDINVGNVQLKPGQLAPRKIVNVIEGPIIQENKCK